MTYPTFRGFGLAPQAERRLDALLDDLCRRHGVAMGTLEAGEIAVEIYAAYLRIQRERGASVVPALVSLMGSRQGELVRRAA